MTADEIHNHAIRFRRFQQSRENYFAPLINEALNKQYSQFIHHFHSEGISAVNKIDSGGIMQIIRNLYMDAGIVYGAKIRADFNKIGAYKWSNSTTLELKNRRPIGFSERMAQLIAQYFRTDILNTSEGITQTTKDLIKRVFTQAYVEGLGINEIIKQLENTELSRIRARLIARTETVTAANKGAMFVAKDTGLLLNKTWLATNDNRTREDHKEVNGHQVGRDQYFNVGGFDMLHPGDRGGHDGKLPVPPKEICNCRCTHTFQAVRDANGRLVRA